MYNHSRPAASLIKLSTVCAMFYYCSLRSRSAKLSLLSGTLCKNTHQSRSFTSFWQLQQAVLWRWKLLIFSSLMCHLLLWMKNDVMSLVLRNYVVCVCVCLYLVVHRFDGGMTWGLSCQVLASYSLLTLVSTPLRDFIWMCRQRFKSLGCIRGLTLVNCSISTRCWCSYLKGLCLVNICIYRLNLSFQIQTQQWSSLYCTYLVLNARHGWFSGYEASGQMILETHQSADCRHHICCFWLLL